MKHTLHILLYLNIYTALANIAFGQQLTLTLEAEKKITLETLNNISPNISFSNYTDLEKESTRILDAFQKIGFIDSRLISINKNIDGETTGEERIYTATYFLGPKFSSIIIYFDQENFSKKKIARFTNGINDDYFIIPISEVENTLAKLNNLLTEKGDAFAKIYLSNFKKSGDKLTAKLISEETGTRTIDSIIIKGYEKFPKSYIRHVAGIKKGSIFKRSKIEKANNAIEALPFASNLKSPEVLFKDEKTSLYLYLEKKQSNNFDGIIGFSTDDTTNRLVFNGYLDLELNNNLNYGETITLNYKSDGDDQKNFNIKTTLAYILRTPLGINLGLTIFKQAENFSTTSQLAGLQYQINSNAIAALNYTSTNSTILSDEETTITNLVPFKKKEISIGSQWKYYQADALFPIKTIINLQIGTGTKKIDLINETQYRLEATASHILNFNEQNSFFITNQSGLLNSDTYLSNELYRVGGINSIRGFKENAIEASLYSFLITEYRYRFTNLLYLHSIVDLGYLENKSTKNTNSLYSFGLGTGFFTKTGLLKFSIANGKIKDQTFNFSDLKIHLSLISTF